MLGACHKAAPAEIGAQPVVVLAAQATGIGSHGGAALTLPAEVAARFETTMAFRVAGQVIERRVHLGDVVHQGEILARLDPADAQRNDASARADMAAAHERLANALQQLQRDTAQARENLISPLQLEQTQDAYAAALSQDKDAVARAGLAANQLSYTNLIAPHDGVISAEQADTGQVVSPGQAVFSLAWSGATDVTTDLAESQVGAVHIGEAAEVTLAALPAHVLHGTVREIGTVADPQSRTFHVKITLDPQDARNAALRLGMTGTVALGTGEADVAGTVGVGPAAVMIPATALFHKGDKPAVWVVGSDGHLQLRVVEVAAYGANSVTLASGLAAGERFVAQGVHTLTVGEAVQPVAPLHPEDFAL